MVICKRNIGLVIFGMLSERSVPKTIGEIGESHLKTTVEVYPLSKKCGGERRRGDDDDEAGTTTTTTTTTPARAGRAADARAVSPLIHYGNSCRQYNSQPMERCTI